MDKPFQIGMLLLPAFNSMAGLAFIDPFRAANYLQQRRLYEWEFLSLDGEDVTASNCLAVTDTLELQNPTKHYDFLVVNASWTPEKYQSSNLKTKLRTFANQGTTLVGIDTGAFILAWAGLLDGYHATVHIEHLVSFQELYPDTAVEPVLYVVDRNRLTCCGGMASSDLALEIIRQQQGYELSNAAARYIFQERLRGGDVSQIPPQRGAANYALPTALGEAILLMERNLEEPIKLDKIAQYAGVSQRQLQRLFVKYTGRTPVGYYLHARLNRAQALITQTGLSVTEIACACGFSNPEQFTRAYKKQFSIVPSKDRMKGRIPFQFRTLPG